MRPCQGNTPEPARVLGWLRARAAWPCGQCTATVQLLVAPSGPIHPSSGRHVLEMHLDQPLQQAAISACECDTNNSNMCAYVPRGKRSGCARASEWKRTQHLLASEGVGEIWATLLAGSPPFFFFLISCQGPNQPHQFPTLSTEKSSTIQVCMAQPPANILPAKLFHLELQIL